MAIIIIQNHVALTPGTFDLEASKECFKTTAKIGIERRVGKSQKTSKHFQCRLSDPKDAPGGPLVIANEPVGREVFPIGRGNDDGRGG